MRKRLKGRGFTLVELAIVMVIIGLMIGAVLKGQAMIDDAKQSAEKAATQLKEYEAKLAAAGEEARDMVSQARKDAEAAKERIVAEAQDAAERERQRAVADRPNRTAGAKVEAPRCGPQARSAEPARLPRPA